MSEERLDTPEVTTRVEQIRNRISALDEGLVRRAAVVGTALGAGPTLIVASATEFAFTLLHTLPGPEHVLARIPGFSIASGELLLGLPLSAAGVILGAGLMRDRLQVLWLNKSLQAQEKGEPMQPFGTWLKSSVTDLMQGVVNWLDQKGEKSISG